METEKEREEERLRRIQEREDLTTPHTLEVEDVGSSFGTDIQEAEAHEQELAIIVDKMKEELVHETKILEGTEIPTYASLLENELSNGEQETK